MKIWVLHDRISPQAGPDQSDVLHQAAAVASALNERGHQTVVTDTDSDLAELRDRLISARPDLVFNLVESLDGHGRLIHLVPSLLDTLGIRYTGCPAEAVMLTSHKLMTKGLLRRAGLATPDWLVGDRENIGLARSSFRGEHERWIVKSIWEDASLGLDDDALVDGRSADARRALHERADRVGAPWFAEAYIDGREFNLSLLEGPRGVEVLPVAEMLFEDYPADKPNIVGWAAKWRPDSFEYTHTVRSFASLAADAALRTRMERLARDCWTLCGLRGWARIDLRVDATGRPWVLEINANPCLAPDAGFAAAVLESGHRFAGAVASIVAVAVRDEPTPPRDQDLAPIGGRRGG